MLGCGRTLGMGSSSPVSHYYSARAVRFGGYGSINLWELAGSKGAYDLKISRSRPENCVHCTSRSAACGFTEIPADD